MLEGTAGRQAALFAHRDVTELYEAADALMQVQLSSLLQRIMFEFSSELKATGLEDMPTFTVKLLMAGGTMVMEPSVADVVHRLEASINSIANSCHEVRSTGEMGRWG